MGIFQSDLDTSDTSHARRMYVCMYVYIYIHVYASGGKTAPAFCTFLQRRTLGTLRQGFGVGVGWGDVNVHVNLPHMRILRLVLGLGWGGGDVDIHVNLRLMRILRHVLGLGWGGGMLTFMLAYPSKSSTKFCETVTNQQKMLITDGAACHPS